MNTLDLHPNICLYLCVIGVSPPPGCTLVLSPNPARKSLSRLAPDCAVFVDTIIWHQQRCHFKIAFYSTADLGVNGVPIAGRHPVDFPPRCQVSLQGHAAYAGDKSHLIMVTCLWSIAYATCCRNSCLPHEFLARQR